MAGFENVNLDYRNGKITCNKKNVTLHYNTPTGNNKVRWKLGAGMRGGKKVVLYWESGSPFGKFTEDSGKHEILGTNNTRKRGPFKYAIALYGKDGKEISRLDPRIQNDP